VRNLFLRRVRQSRILNHPASPYILSPAMRQIPAIQRSVTCRVCTHLICASNGLKRLLQALVRVPKPATIHAVDAITSMTSSRSGHKKLALAIRAHEKFVSVFN
jgi:hypothetical protein